MVDLLADLNAVLRGRYAVIRPLGRGGTATVFLAHDLKHDRPVALKVLDPDIADGVGPERFLREIRFAAQLQHPLICTVLDSDVVRSEAHPPLYWYAMPYIEGESLRDRLNREGRIPFDDALAILKEASEALHFAHGRGVVHRDVKPENILLSGGHALVADFGIAKALSQGQSDESGRGRVTAAGVVVGTPAYMSPEQASGEEEVDARTDVYALGCVGFEMLAGEPPFSGSARSILVKRMTTDPPGLAEARPELPREVGAAIMKAMARAPDDRFPTALAFSQALTPSRLAPGRGRRWPALLGGLAGLFMAGLLGWTALRGRTTPREPIESIAIRPLATGDSTAQYLSDGIHEAVTDLLRRLPALSVAAPSLVGQLVAREPELDLQDLGRRLDVGAVLTWNLRRIGDSIHLRAELVETNAGRLLWGQTYERPLNDVLAMPNEIARAISDSLRIQLTGTDLANLARQPTRDPEAWDLYLRGRSAYGRASILGGRTAREEADSALYYARESLKRDPDFPGGLLLLSHHYGLSAIRGWREPFGTYMDSAAALTHRAIALDSTFADAWINIGAYHFSFTDRWDSAGAALARGLRLDPDYSQGRMLYGLYEAEALGRIDSGIVHVRRAIELEETPHYLNTLGDLLMRARRWDTAAVVLRRAVALAPAAPGPWSRLVRTLEEMGRYRAAVQIRRNGPDPASANPFAAAFEREGEAGYRRVLVDDHRARIDSLIRELAGPRNVLADTVPPLRERRIAQLYARLGEWTKAMDWVLREYRRRPGRFRLVVTDPDFQGLEADPRYLPLVRKEGLERFLPTAASPPVRNQL